MADLNAQFKKGVLELVVLISLAKNDMYGYEIVSEVSKIIEVNEGTIYPLLKRLTNEKYFETYLRESSEGPPRKYYHLTRSGKAYKDELKEEWLTFNESVTKFIMECDSLLQNMNFSICWSNGSLYSMMMNGQIY